jgi:formylglycine-generating enzyme required for sulfatase activity
MTSVFDSSFLRLAVAFFCAWFVGANAATAASAEKPLVYLGINEQGCAEYLRTRDGMRVVHVPAGEYARRDYEGATAVREPQRVKVAGFLMDKFEVTNEQFAKFLNATKTDESVTWGERILPIVKETPWGLRKVDGKWQPQRGYEHYPAVGVTGWGAALYARWVGAHPPTPDQWMKAAGGPKGQLFAFEQKGEGKFPCNWYGAKNYRTLPVGAIPECVSPVGCYDMAGNVYDRVLTSHARGVDPNSERALRNYVKAISEDKIPDLLPVMIKGGSWVTAHPLNLRVLDLCMQPMEVGDMSVGFRCAMAEIFLTAPLEKPDLKKKAPPVPKHPIVEPTQAGAQRLPSPLPFARSFHDGVAEARERNCTALLSLQYDTCGQCDRVSAEVFTDEAFVKFVEENAVIIVGRDPHAAMDEPHLEEKGGVCSIYPAITCREHLETFYVGMKYARDFSVTPANFIINPHGKFEDDPAQWVLVGERELPKSGQGVDIYIAKMQDAQKQLGPHLTRAEWKQLKAAIADCADGKPDAKEKLAKLAEGRSGEIPLVKEARRILSEK